MAMELRRRPWGGELGREFLPLRQVIDRMFETAFTPAWWGEAQAGWFGMDVYEDDNNFYIRCMLPGVDRNAVNISAHGNVLTISGEAKQEVPGGWRPVFQEIGTGSFQRQVTLDTPVDAGKAEATYRDGMFSITLPKAEAHRPRTIPIKALGAEKQ